MPTESNRPHPAIDFSAASRRIAALQALDTEQVNPVGRTIWLSQREKRERAIVFLHGYTNCPRQFAQLGERFFERGYNVLIPRFPHHGLLDRMTTATALQTEAELLATLNEALDIAQGLGEHVTVCGLSMGGVLALWAAQQRADVHLAAAISAALAFHAIPLKLTPLLATLALRLPNTFMWWSPELKDAPVPPLHAYPRYATRGLARIVTLGLKLKRLSRQAKPKAGSVLVIHNPTDQAVDSTYARQIVDNWRGLGAENVGEYEFEAKYNLKHDLIEPTQPDQQVEVVYPILMDLLELYSTQL